MKLIQKIEILSSLLLISVLIKPAAVMAVNWNDFSHTVNKGFSNENIYDSSKIVAFVVSIIAVIVIIAVFQYWSKRARLEQEVTFQHYKEKQKEIASKTQNPAHKRKWFRLRTQAELRWIPASQTEHIKESKYNVDQLVDISAEGLCFCTAEELAAGTELRFLLDTGEERVLPIAGKALRIFDAEGGAEGDEPVKHNVAVQFTRMSPGDNDRLVAWITKRQRDAIHQKQE